MRYEASVAAGRQFWKATGKAGPVVGKRGPLFRYSVFIEEGLDVDRDVVVRMIDRTLADERGWTRGAVRFQRVPSGADTDAYLAAPATVDKLCVPLKTEGKVSCCVGRNVVFNVLRWSTAVPHWRPGMPGRLTSYRQMVINHEFGHRIGKNHGYCPGEKKRAPVMQQQTYGMQGCLENSWPLASELLRE